MNQNTSGTVGTDNVANLNNLMAVGPLGFFAPLMYSLVYANIVASLINKYEDATQLRDIANRTIQEIWPSFIQTFQLGGGFQGVGNVGTTHNRQVA